MAAKMLANTFHITREYDCELTDYGNLMSTKVQGGEKESACLKYVIQQDSPRTPIPSSHKDKSNVKL